MNERPHISIIDTLKSIDQTEDKDIAFIFAAAINLYIEAIRRLRGRVMLGPDDIPHILDIIATLTHKAPDVAAFAVDPSLRTRELTAEETANLLQAIEPQVVRRA